MKHTALFRVWLLVLLANRAPFGQLTAAQRAITPAVAAIGAPAITILAVADGALLRSHGAGNASLDLGPISYFRGTSAPGQSSRKTSTSLVISTRFVLKVDCPGSSSSSRVGVTVSRLDAAASNTIAIDGTTVGFAVQPLVQSMSCGSGGEHRLDVEVPVSAPAGSIDTTVAFVATPNR